MFTKSIPNMLTLGNLFLGMIGMMMALKGEYSMAAIMIIIAMLCDGLDGRVARALHAESEFGKQLDSLSDVISFGVAPALLMYMVSFQEVPQMLSWVVVAIFPMCGALRLARFNVKKGIPGYFVGLPIPAAGGVLATLSLFHEDISAVYMIISTLLLSFLMVSSVKYPNFKKVGFPKKAVIGAPIVIVAAVAIAIIFPDQISKLIFVPLVLYAGYGLKHNFEKLTRRRKNTKSSTNEEDVYRSEN